MHIGYSLFQKIDIFDGDRVLICGLSVIPEYFYKHRGQALPYDLKISRMTGGYFVRDDIEQGQIILIVVPVDIMLAGTGFKIDKLNKIVFVQRGIFIGIINSNFLSLSYAVVADHQIIISCFHLSVYLPLFTFYIHYNKI